MVGVRPLSGSGLSPLLRTFTPGGADCAPPGAIRVRPLRGPGHAGKPDLQRFPAPLNNYEESWSPTVVGMIPGKQRPLSEVKNMGDGKGEIR